MAKVCCSIEMEPRTLSQVQLNHARNLVNLLASQYVQEVAADVVQRMEPNEASAIFIEGLSPVGSLKEMKHMIDGEGEQLQSKLVELKEEAQVFDIPCQCLCPTPNVESPGQERLTEPLSAPF